MVVFVAVVGLIAAAVFIADDDGGDIPTTTTPSAVPTTDAPVNTTTPPPVDTTTAVFPFAGSALRYDDPVEAARAFAVDFVGFVDPVVGEFQQGDSQSGEVEVRPAANGPTTTVMVRRLGESWWVLGSATANIELREPAALATIASPVRLTGVSTAFEANVSIEIREDGASRPIGEGYVMGGSMGDLAPFDGTVSFRAPTSAMGAIVAFTASMENGNVWEASVVRIRFSQANGLAPAVACPDFSVPRPAAAAGQMVVTVFFTCEAGGPAKPAYRAVPASSAVLRAALEQLLAGPTAAERDAGLQSWFSSATASMLADVTVRDGRAVVDFHDLRPVIPNASTSAGSELLLAQLDATVFQFSSVSSVVYRIDGDCEAFNEWLQYGGCERRTRGR